MDMTSRMSTPYGRRRWIFVGLVLGCITAAAAQQPSELIIRNGVVVTAVGRTEGDLRIRNGTIAEIGRNLAAAAGAREVDAKGMLVLPGGVDPHVHLGGGPRAGADDYTTGSRAALAGGITTIANFISPGAGEDLTATLEKATALVRAQAIADVILHVTINDPSVATAANLATLADRGYSPKIFLSRPQFDQNAAEFLKAIRAAGSAGVLTMLHCEDASILNTTAERMMAEGRSSIRYFSESRPVVAEEIATQRAVAMSEATGAPIYIVHLSSERALRVVEAAQARGLPVYVESRILYLHLTKERFEQPDANIYTGYPPLREKNDVDALWDGIAKGTVHVVATDHVSYTRAEKMDPSVNIVNARPAGNYLQVNLPLMYSEGVRKGRISLEKMVAVTSTNPAKLFGLYPRKGTIAVGSDADVVIWDPNMRRTVRDEDQLSNAKFSIFSGWDVTGWPVVTIRRGEIVYQNGKVLGTAGSGQLTPRQRWQRPTLS
jgi:dihydropyrimidinase